jgi:ADP-glucose pyrophosphorylase
VVTGNSKVSNACIFDDAVVAGEARVEGESLIGQRSRVDGEARVIGPAQLYDDARVTGRAWVSGGMIRGNAVVDGQTVVREGTTLGRPTGRAGAPASDPAVPGRSDVVRHDLEADIEPVADAANEPDPGLQPEEPIVRETLGIDELIDETMAGAHVG